MSWDNTKHSQVGPHEGGGLSEQTTTRLNESSLHVVKSTCNNTSNEQSLSFLNGVCRWRFECKPLLMFFLKIGVKGWVTLVVLP